MTSLSRRGLLKAGLAAPLLTGASTPMLALANGVSGRRTLVSVFLRGGLDGLNTVAPYGDDDYYRLRPTLALGPPGSGSDALLRLDALFGLHPSLAPLKPLFDAGELAFVHASGAPHGSRSHFDAMRRLEQADWERPNHTGAEGWIARHLIAAGHEEPLAAVSMGTAVAASLRGSPGVLALPALEGFGLGAMPELVALGVEALYLAPTDARQREIAGQVFEAARRLDAVDRGSAPRHGAQYPATPFGNQLADIARLIHADVGLAAANIDFGGWDHHVDEAPRLAALLTQLAGALAAFRQDLGPRFADVELVVLSEFGRRAQENASRGTDHGSGNLVMLLGGGVQGGRVYGDWPGLAADQLDQGDLRITTDYRQLLAELLQRRFAHADPAQLFPGWQPRAALGLYR